MERKVKSFRVRTDLLDWLESYARTRKTTQVAVLEGALVSFRGDAGGGVPELVAEPVQVVAKRRPVSRQDRLNAMIDQARARSPR